MRKRFAITALAFVMFEGAGTAVDSTRSAEAAYGCLTSKSFGGCCFCRYDRIYPKTLSNCVDGCPSCSGNFCSIAVDPIFGRIGGPIWGQSF
jgi:hypothetical protein